MKKTENGQLQLALNPQYQKVKRIRDIICSLVGIVVFFPVMCMVALLVKLQDGGNILYRQTRLTQNGQRFEIYKFRSMGMNAEVDGRPQLARKNDPRITKLGGILRKSHLDELPQLFNILKGDMSLVGPRPERPELTEKYTKELPDFELRLQVKAGLTGYAQVYGDYDTPPKEKLQMDLTYIENPMLMMDLKLIIKTIIGVILCEYGEEPSISREGNRNWHEI